MSNINFNSFNEFLNTHNINPTLNQTMNTTTLSQSIFIPNNQNSSSPTLFYSYEDINSTYIPSSTTLWINLGETYSTTNMQPSINHIDTYMPTPTPIPIPTPTHQTSLGHTGMYSPTPVPTPNNYMYSPTPVPTPNNYMYSPTPIATYPPTSSPPFYSNIIWSGNGSQPNGWNPSWGATGTHPPYTIHSQWVGSGTHNVMGDTGATGYFTPVPMTSPTPSSYLGLTGHTGYCNYNKNTLFSNKFSFEDKEFSINIHYIDDKQSKFLRRVYHLKCKYLDIKTVLKINEDTFEPIHNKKFDKIVEIVEKLSKMNLYYSNVCKNVLIKDIFMNKRVNNRFEIEI